MSVKSLILLGGEYENRTRVHGFAIRCVTTPPTRHLWFGCALAANSGWFNRVFVCTTLYQHAAAQWAVADAVGLACRGGVGADARIADDVLGAACDHRRAAYRGRGL